MSNSIHLFDAVKGNPADEYFYLDGISNRLGCKRYYEVGSERSVAITKYRLAATIIKIISYMTVILPIIFLIYKAIDQYKAKKINKENLLHQAVANNDLKSVLKYLQTRGVDVNKQDEMGETPLHHAVIQSHACSHIVPLLLQNRNINTEIKRYKDDHGYDSEFTPLEMANRRRVGRSEGATCEWEPNLVAYWLLHPQLSRSEDSTNYVIPDKANFSLSERNEIVQIANEKLKNHCFS